MRSDAKKILKVGLFSALIIFILVYAFIRSKGLIFGVTIKNVNLKNGETVTENVLNIDGNAKNAISLSLNDREISVDQDGNFNETVLLLPGYNTVTIKAKDKFGNSDEKDYQLIYSAPAEQ